MFSPFIFPSCSVFPIFLVTFRCPYRLPADEPLPPCLFQNADEGLVTLSAAQVSSERIWPRFISLFLYLSFLFSLTSSFTNFFLYLFLYLSFRFSLILLTFPFSKQFVIFFLFVTSIASPSLIFLSPNLYLNRNSNLFSQLRVQSLSTSL